MKHASEPKQNRLLPAMLMGSVSLYALNQFGWSFTNRQGEIELLPAMAAGILGISVLAAITDGCCLLADALELLHAKTPRGHKARAGWATWQELRRKGDVKGRYGWGPYWGIYQPRWISKKRPIIADYASNSVCFGSAGAGKGVGAVLPTSLTIHESKLILDFKSVNSCILKPALEARGERLEVLNIGGLYEDILGASACYNPLQLIADHFSRKGGLGDISTDCAEMAMQLLPEPEASDENRFWNHGSRNLIAMAIAQSVLVYGTQGTLMHTYQLLHDREAFRREMCWAAGTLQDAEGILLPPMPLEHSPWAVRHDLHTEEDISTFIAEYRRRCAVMADLLSAPDTRTADSFLTGAQQALQEFRPESHAARILSSSSFRFGDMKDKGQVLNVALAVDATRMATQSKIAGLLQWCAITEWLRHGNKHKPVYVIGDEITNLKVHRLPELLTYGREFSIKLALYIQSLCAFEDVYGKEAVSTLLGQTEIKQFLPGQRDPQMLELIRNMLGEESIVTTSYSHNGTFSSGMNRSFSEESVPLMTEDEIRRMTHGLLFIRHCRPVKIKLPPISAMHPFKHQIGNNPMYSKPWKKRTQLRFGSRTLWPARLWRGVKRLIKRGDQS